MVPVAAAVNAVGPIEPALRTRSRRRAAPADVSLSRSPPHSPMASSTPDIDQVEARMRPGVLSVGGFLGPNEDLRAVMTADDLAMQRTGVTFEALAAAIEALIAAASASSTHEAIVNGTHHVRIQQYRGFQICPWSPDPHHVGLAQQRYVKSHRNPFRSPRSGLHPGTPYRPIRVTGVGRPQGSFCFRGPISAESVRRRGPWTSGRSASDGGTNAGAAAA